MISLVTGSLGSISGACTCKVVVSLPRRRATTSLVKGLNYPCGVGDVVHHRDLDSLNMPTSSSGDSGDHTGTFPSCLLTYVRAQCVSNGNIHGRICVEKLSQ